MKITEIHEHADLHSAAEKVKKITADLESIRGELRAVIAAHAAAYSNLKPLTLYKILANEILGDNRRWELIRDIYKGTGDRFITKIKAAAIKFPGGALYTGRSYNKIYDKWRLDPRDGAGEYGFITNAGIFVDPKQAAAIAYKAGQIFTERVWLDPENLY